MLAKAKLVEIKWDDQQQEAQDVPGGKVVAAQFNPQTLKLSFQNQNKGGDQPGGSSKQFVGSGTAKMQVELLFDTSAGGGDVRKHTEAVAFFIAAKPEPGADSKRTPPGVRFEWGSFIFQGVVDGLDETLDYFSEEGVPLRATLALSLSRQAIEFLFGKPAQAAGAAPGIPGAAPGTAPLEPAQAGDSVQRLAGRAGRSGDWKAIAAANGIEDPLRLPPGSLVDVNRGGRTGAAALDQLRRRG